MRTIDINSTIIQPLKDAIHHQFIPVLTSQASSSPGVENPLPPPTQLGGLNIVYTIEKAESRLKASKAITTLLKRIEQSEQFTTNRMHCVFSIDYMETEKCDCVCGSVFSTEP